MKEDAKLVNSNLNMVEDSLLFNQVLAELAIPDPVEDKLLEELDEHTETRSD
jgi:hypothetical protein